MTYNRIQQRALEVLEPGRLGDLYSKITDHLIAALVILNIMAVTLESVSDFSSHLCVSILLFRSV